MREDLLGIQIQTQIQTEGGDGEPALVADMRAVSGDQGVFTMWWFGQRSPGNRHLTPAE